jgi:hypothetical protein
MDKQRNAFPDRRIGVYCCGHVFRHERPVLYISHEDGDWQFLCGGSDHADPNEPYHVSVGALINCDPTLDGISDLAVDWEAERQSTGDLWLRTKCGAVSS